MKDFPITNRKPEFERHLVDIFDLKASEAKPGIIPGIQPVWLTRPIGISYLERSCVYPVAFADFNVTSNIGVAATRDGPTAWSSRKFHTANATKNLFDGIPANFCFQVKTYIVALVAPTAAIAISIDILTSATSTLKYSFETRIGPINHQPIHWTSPVFYSDLEMQIDYAVASISGVGQSIECMGELFVYPVLQGQS